MLRARILHWLGTSAFLGGGLAVLAAAATVGYLNHTGLPEAWRHAIEQELAKRGINAEVAQLRYIPLRGIVADDVRLFSGDSSRAETARFQRLVFDADKAQLLRGNFKLTRIELQDARVVLPTDPDNPAPPLVIENLTGRVLMGVGRRVEIREASGRVGGVDLEFSARVDGYRNRPGSEEDQRQQQLARNRMFARLSEELGRWSIDPGQAPRVRVFLEGDLANESSLRADFALSARSLGRNDYTLRDVEVAGTWEGGLVALHTATARDDLGAFDCHIDCDLNRQRARFRGNSNLNLARLLRAFTNSDPLADLSFGSPPRIEADGSVDWSSGEFPAVRAVGELECGTLSFRGVMFESLTGNFAVDGNQVYLRDALVTHRHGKANGRVLVRPREIRYEMRSSLPLAVFRPLFAGQPLDRFFLRDVEELPGFAIDIQIEGSLDPTDLRNWACQGHADSKHVAYRGARMREFHGDFTLSEPEMRFTDCSTVLDDGAYPLRKLNAPPGRASATSVLVDNVRQRVEIDHLKGTFWPALMIRPFNPEVAAQLETYRFHTAPELESSGTIDFSRRGRDTNLLTRFRCRAPADYVFLDQPLELLEPAAEVLVTGDRTVIKGLSATLFDGRIDTDITVRHTLNPQQMSGEFRWTGLSLPAIAATYGFQQKGEGRLTGRVQFEGPAGTAKGMDGKGVIALENGELFAVPIFGPLSPLVSAVLGSRRLGYERAQNAFCTFTIDDGILSTRDFRTKTTSIAFSGDGTVDLDQMTLEMTMRMNARGLLGVITLPLRPFYGLFQFRGTGPLAEPHWRSVMFTPPPEGENDELLEKPPKALPVGEPPPAEKPEAPKPAPARTRPLRRP